MRIISRLCLLLLVVSFILSQKMSAATVTVCDEASLRAAITNGGTINFGCDGTIVLSSTLQITTNTVLDGTDHNVVLSGGDAVRVLFVATNIDLTINNLTIANGKLVGTNGVNMSNGERTPGESVFGAGIYNNGGSILLSGCSLLNNATIGGNGGNGDSVSKALGAAIYNDGGFLTITNTVIAGNSCLGGSGGGGFSLQFGDTGANAFGGALYSKNGTVVITASEVRSNNVTGGIASSDGISYRGGSSSGGALFIENGPISINQTRFSDNRANGGARSPDLGNDGNPTGSARGGAAYFTNSTATISLCKFLTNSSAAASDGGRFSGSGITQGGAIFNAGTLDVIDTLLAGNTSLGGEAAHGGGESDGGALCNIASLKISRSTIAGNEALAGAGLPRSGRSGPGRGGGIYNAGNFGGTNVTIVLNQAAGASGSDPFSPLEASNGEGGGIFNLGVMSLVQSTVASNVVRPGLNGGLFILPPGLALGAEVYSTNGPAIVQNSIIGSSLSGSNCFGVLIDNGNNLSSDASCQFTAPGSLNNTDPLLSPLADFGGPTPTMALLAGSPAIDHGLATYCPATDQRGFARPFGSGCDIGAFEVTPSAPITVYDESSLRAAITNGGTINFGVDGTIVLSSTLQITTNTVLDGTGHNVVLSGGDAVRVFFVATNINFTAANLTIANGKQQGTNGVGETIAESAFGAGILNDGGRMVLTGCSLLNNTTVGGNYFDLLFPNNLPPDSSCGAAIYNNNGSISLSNCFASGNLCRGGFGSSFLGGLIGGPAQGAALCSQGGTVIIANSEIQNNIAAGDDIVNMAQSGVLRPALGSGSGGALYATNATISIIQTRFTGNQANGGSIRVNAPLNGDAGPAFGGAVYLANCNAKISLCQFLTNNSVAGIPTRYGSGAPSQGGAIFNTGNLLLEDGLFANNRSQGGTGNIQSEQDGGGESDGGAICNFGSITLYRSTISNNQARGGDGFAPSSISAPGGVGKGGGIYNQGTLAVSDSALVSNHAIGGDGGGIPCCGGSAHGGDGKGGGVFNQGDFKGTNMTVTSNQAGGGERGIPNFHTSAPEVGGSGDGGGIFNQASMILVHATLALNEAEAGGPIDAAGLAMGGGIFTTNGSSTLQNTIIANSLSGSNSLGALIDDGNNLSSDASCQFTAPGSLNNTDPLLSPLDDFGGPTPTMALLAVSPAIDHGLAIYCPATDQRGIARPFGGACDIGAFELKTYQFNALTVESYTNQILHLIFTGTNGQSCQVQTTTNLFDWTSIVTNQVGTNGILDFFYTNDLAEPFRSFQTYTP